MVSKITKRTPKKSIKDRRGHNRKISPAVKTSSTSKLISSLNKTIYACKRRLVKIFSKLAHISSTPKISSRSKGYKALKRLHERDPFDPEKEVLEDQFLGRESICKALFCQQKLPPLISQNRRTVFLDLDETLVHSKADPPPEKFDFIVRPRIDGVYANFYVLKRPGLDDFLEALGKKYEVVVFTAGLKKYARLVLDSIDRKGMISHRLFRDSCKEVDGKFVKDLSETGRDLRRAMIVDDNPNCYCFQPDNAIPMRPFLNDLLDRELGKLLKFFDECDRFEDMRDAVKQYVSCTEWEDLKRHADKLVQFKTRGRNRNNN